MAVRLYVKSVIIGLSATILSVIVTVAALIALLVRSQHQIPVGPPYLLIPIAAFALGFYWSVRRSGRPKPPPTPPSRAVIIAKSALVGIVVVLLSDIAYIGWIWLGIPRTTGVFVSIDAFALLHRGWPWLAAAFVAGFMLQFFRASKLRSSRRFR